MNPPSFQLRQCCHVERLHHSLQQVSITGTHSPSYAAKSIRTPRSPNCNNCRLTIYEYVCINIYSIPIYGYTYSKNKSLGRKVTEGLDVFTTHLSHLHTCATTHCANIGESESHDGVRHVLLVRWCVGTAIWLLSCSFDIAADRQFKHHRICTGLVAQPSSTATQHLTWGIQNHGLLAALPSLHSDAYTDVPVSAHLPEAPGLPVTTKSMFTDVHSGCHMFRHCPLQITLTTSIIPLTLAPDPRWCLQPTIPAQGCPLFLEAPEAPGLKRPTQCAGKPPSMIQQAKSHKFHWALCASDRCSFRNASVQKASEGFFSELYGH